MGLAETPLDRPRRGPHEAEVRCDRDSLDRFEAGRRRIPERLLAGFRKHQPHQVDVPGRDFHPLDRTSFSWRTRCYAIPNRLH